MARVVYSVVLLTLLTLMNEISTTEQHSVSLSVESSPTGSYLSAECLTEGCHKIWESEHVSTSQELDKSDGIVLMILSEENGSVLLKKTFNTYNFFTYAQDLAWWLRRVKAGRVVILRVHRAGTYGIDAAIPVLSSFGSLLAGYAPPRALWVWVFIAGGRTVLETISPSTRRPLDDSNAELHANAPIDFTPSVRESGDLHSQLCATEASMGPFCDSDSVDGTGLKEMKHKDDQEKKIGVVVCAGGRVQYLANTLLKLFDNELMRSNVLVVVSRGADGEVNKSVTTLLQVLNIQYEVVPIPNDVPSINHGLFQFYRKAWTAGVETFSDLDYIAFLDEDVEVSRDWLDTLAHFAPALDTDASLWCISGSAPGHRNIFPDPKMFLRGFRQPGWGYLFSMDEARAMVAKWPESSSVSLLYDTFLYNVMSRGRECLFPALSRTHHYGVGVNTVPELHQLYFLDQPLHSGERVKLPPIEEITREAYEKKLLTSLQIATPLTRNPCAPGFLIPPSAQEPKDFVFYFYMKDPNDSPEWTTLAECIGAWPYSTQGHHHGCFQVPQPWDGSLWIVGVPYSKYSYLRSPEIPVWQIKSEKQLFAAVQFSNSLRIPNKINRTLSLAYTELFS